MGKLREALKGWKTLLFNIGTLLALAGDQFAGTGLIDPKTALVISGLGNVFLRFVTNTRVGHKA